MTATETEIFKALSDPTRRAMLDRLAAGSATATALGEGFPISQPAVSQHLATLRRAGLVRESREGRFRRYEVDPDGLAAVAGWLARYRAWWPDRIDALRDLLKDMDQ